MIRREPSSPALTDLCDNRELRKPPKDSNGFVVFSGDYGPWRPAVQGDNSEHKIVFGFFDIGTLALLGSLGAVVASDALNRARDGAEPVLITPRLLVSGSFIPGLILPVDMHDFHDSKSDAFASGSARGLEIIRDAFTPFEKVYRGFGFKPNELAIAALCAAQKSVITDNLHGQPSSERYGFRIENPSN